jgi:uncharacterized protein YbaP (TraB family)
MNERAGNGNAKRLLLKWTLHGVGGGAAISLGLALIEALKQRPEMLPQLLNGGFLSFLALVAGMVIFDRRLGQFAEAHGRGVAAQEELASSVTMLAQKDDQRAREQDILLDHLAHGQQQILDEILELRKETP